MTNTGCVARVGRAGPEGGDSLFVSNDITPRKDSVSLVDKEPVGRGRLVSFPSGRLNC